MPAPFLSLDDFRHTLAGPSAGMLFPQIFHGLFPHENLYSTMTYRTRLTLTILSETSTYPLFRPLSLCPIFSHSTYPPYNILHN